ncbi:MAG TPA: hypothetical protein VHO72_13960 [Bacteroidales bacterium]|nr:hypothetical protein [Bacteroidales bacterium]
MMRLAIVILQLLSLFSLSMLFSGDVSMEIDAPGQINAGKEITVTVTLNKADLKDFSRFQMELPNGLTAENISSSNADFSFKDQKVRLIWLRLPEEKSITFSFKIISNERLKGSFDLNGKFSYIENNARKSVDFTPKHVAIVPNPSIDPTLLVDIKDFGKSIYQNASISETQIACIRQKPLWNEVNKEYVVSILVNKEQLKKFAKIEENIPAGFTAINIYGNEGIFTFKDGKVKYLWMNLPADNYFTVSYKLIPSNGMKDALITGSFSYITDDKTKSIPIVEKNTDLANLTTEKVRSILLAPTAVIASVSPADTTKTIAAVNTPVKEDKVIKQPVTTVKDDSKNVAQVKTPVKQTSEELSDLLEPQIGIYYRVQIAAGHKPINIKSYFRKFKLDNKVFQENHDGWIKYSIGSFPQYREARDYRVHLWNTTSMTDAFVSAYNEGKRITVQEALMIANQKWYK